ncbi:hypothetical protein KY285_016990 [Solanum tuberosum]|nr:hypothetical protein KY285_016990 [Solanum tuberosum]
MRIHHHDEELPSGFVSLDCGGKDNFTDELGLEWTPDTQMISGVIVNLSVANETRTQYMALRYFPADNRKYCYTLDVIPQTVGATHWATIVIPDANTMEYQEVIYLAKEPSNDFFMSVSARINFGTESDDPVRYPDDPFDRIWTLLGTGSVFSSSAPDYKVVLEPSSII